MNLFEKLKQLEAEATPGEWSVHSCGHIEATCRGGFVDATMNPRRYADAKLMVEMRNSLPKLLAVVEAARTGCPTLLNAALDRLEEDV